MLVCDVIGTVVATRKISGFVGCKLLVVRPAASRSRTATAAGDFVAVDTVGAGLGDKVIVTQGSNAGLALEQDGVPVDAAIVGIIDTLEVQGK